MHVCRHACVYLKHFWKGLQVVSTKENWGSTERSGQWSYFSLHTIDEPPNWDFYFVHEFFCKEYYPFHLEAESQVQESEPHHMGLSVWAGDKLTAWCPPKVENQQDFVEVLAIIMKWKLCRETMSQQVGGKRECWFLKLPESWGERNGNWVCHKASFSYQDSAVWVFLNECSSEYCKSLAYFQSSEKLILICCQCSYCLYGGGDFQKSLLCHSRNASWLPFSWDTSCSKTSPDSVTKMQVIWLVFF